MQRLALLTALLLLTPHVASAQTFSFPSAAGGSLAGGWYVDGAGMKVEVDFGAGNKMAVVDADGAATATDTSVFGGTLARSLVQFDFTLSVAMGWDSDEEALADIGSIPETESITLSFRAELDTEAIAELGALTVPIGSSCYVETDADYDSSAVLYLESTLRGGDPESLILIVE